jgi:DNA-binding GntR family transcriptional regulator
MSERTHNKNRLISARLVPASWWRAALGRLGARKARRYQQMLERLAAAEVTDTVGEEQVKSLLALLERESARAANKDPTRR